MPELPEVETVRRGLEAHLVGRRLRTTEVLHPRAARRHVAGDLDLTGRLRDAEVLGVRRRGKYMWLDVGRGDDRAAVVVHLGMSGQMLIARAGAPDHTHLRIRAALDDGNELRFVDQRTFGGWHVDDYVGDTGPARFAPGGHTEDAAGQHDSIPESIAHIARDPFDDRFDPAAVIAVIRTKHSEIKRVLLDQTVISGVGNIYADEALWRARLHGSRIADGISRAKLTELLTAVSDVMAEALEVGGTSFDALYVNVNGQSGYFSRELHSYGREGLPCHRCGTLIRREAFMNRSSFYCPRCQPVARRRA